MACWKIHYLSVCFRVKLDFNLDLNLNFVREFPSLPCQIHPSEAFLNPSTVRYNPPEEELRVLQPGQTAVDEMIWYQSCLQHPTTINIIYYTFVKYIILYMFWIALLAHFYLFVCSFVNFCPHWWILSMLQYVAYMVVRVSLPVRFVWDTQILEVRLDSMYIIIDSLTGILRG